MPAPSGNRTKEAKPAGKAVKAASTQMVQTRKKRWPWVIGLVASFLVVLFVGKRIFYRPPLDPGDQGKAHPDQLMPKEFTNNLGMEFVQIGRASCRERV